MGNSVKYWAQLSLLDKRIDFNQVRAAQNVLLQPGFALAPDLVHGKSFDRGDKNKTQVGLTFTWLDAFKGPTTLAPRYDDMPSREARRP